VRQIRQRPSRLVCSNCSIGAPHARIRTPALSLLSFG
jgi:hypothetical protein